MNMSMKPDTLLILAAIGIGGYWFLTRNARATTGRGALLPAGAGATVNRRPATQDPYSPLLNGLGQKLGSWLGTNTTPQVTGPDLQAINPAPGSDWDPNEINGLF